jgi:hypothetical protein
MNRPDPRAAGGWQPDYEAKLLNRVLTPAMCQAAIETAVSLGFESSPVFYGEEAADNPEHRKSESAWLTPEQAPDLYQSITGTLKEANDQLYRFSIYGMDQIQIIKYEPGAFFIEHTDIARAHAAYRKISLLVQLSSEDDYQGGEVVLAGRITVPKGLGDGCVFPSWVPHRVDEITLGTRYSLAAWAKGAWFN